MLRRIDFNEIENIISKALTHAEISQKDFVLINKEAEKYSKLKESISMTKRQRIDLERDKLMDEDKNIGINIMIKKFNNLNQSL